MEWFNERILSVVLFLPLLLGMLGLLFPTKTETGQNVYKYYVLVASLIGFVASLFLLQAFNAGGEEFQHIEKFEWIQSLGISYHLGIDGISLWLILLTTFLTPITILASFSAVETRIKEYYFLLLFLETAMLGAFVSLDMFLFYVFWEAMLIPMYFLIGIWGGKDKIFAANKFFLYTLVGSLLMLTSVFYLIVEHSRQFGSISASIVDLYRLKLPGGAFWSPQTLLFLAFSLAFAIKVPLFPFHTWLPDAHVQAPTAGSVILAGILLKMGGYGFIRFAFPLFPEAVQRFQLLFLILGSIAIVYGAWVAMVQTDIKKLVAYSSVSHMGYVMIGLFSLNALGATGAVYQMLNHGISTGALFLLVGMIYERRHTREISEFGGISKVMPIFAIIFLIVTLSSIALPGTNGFVGEFLILLGSWKVQALWTAIAGTGVVFGAVYMLWVFKRVMYGPVTNPKNQSLSDLCFREILVTVPLLIAIFTMGIRPNFILGSLEPSVNRFLARTVPGASASAALNGKAIAQEVVR